MYRVEEMSGIVIAGPHPLLLGYVGPLKKVGQEQGRRDAQA
jgi:uncharacterized membrane protein